ncbi:MAG: methylthioribulose 1-phosphate dehydratase [Nitrospirota bacterium]
MDDTYDFKVFADQLADIAQWASRKGWAPATSTNYSVRLPEHAAPAFCAITSSGVDKERFDPAQVLAVDRIGVPVNGCTLKPSAETLLHVMLYHAMGTGAVLHTHSLAAALLSRSAGESSCLKFSGWELLKGLDGVDTHDCEVVLPVFPNSQDIPALAAHIKTRLPRTQPCYGFLLAGHGLYVWGKDIATAKRHLEVFEFLLQCEREVRSHGYPANA